METTIIIRAPLSAGQLQQHIQDGRVRLALPVTMDELLGCQDRDGFHDLVDARVCGEGVHGCFADLQFRALGVMPGNQILIEVEASTEDLQLDHVIHGKFREPFGRHNPNAQALAFEDVADRYEAELQEASCG